MTDHEWMRDGNCTSGYDPDEWINETTEAKLICTKCPVRDECLDYAVKRDPMPGIFGGLTEAQRARMRR